MCYSADSLVNAPIAPNTRAFHYPSLENVFIMESDPDGNVMPKGFCFLAFYGSHGLMGEGMKVDKLEAASKEEIQKLAESHSEG